MKTTKLITVAFSIQECVDDKLRWIHREVPFCAIEKSPYLDCHRILCDIREVYNYFESLLNIKMGGDYDYKLSLINGLHDEWLSECQEEMNNIFDANQWVDIFFGFLSGSFSPQRLNGVSRFLFGVREIPTLS